MWDQSDLVVLPNLAIIIQCHNIILYYYAFHLLQILVTSVCLSYSILAHRKNVSTSALWMGEQWIPSNSVWWFWTVQTRLKLTRVQNMWSSTLWTENHVRCVCMSIWKCTSSITFHFYPFTFWSACPPAFLFPETPINSTAAFPCSFLDGSFLNGGMITANCTVDSTWDTLDMSQCTFRTDAPVDTVAVVEVVTDSAMQQETLEVTI